jgi:hypothetical protein
MLLQPLLLPLLPAAGPRAYIKALYCTLPGAERGLTCLVTNPQPLSDAAAGAAAAPAAAAAAAAAAVTAAAAARGMFCHVWQHEACQQQLQHNLLLLQVRGGKPTNTQW